MAANITATTYDPQRPICRGGIEVTNLTNGMVYIRHPGLSSQIINRESWAFLQLCDGRSLEELDQLIRERLGFRLTLDQLSAAISNFAEHGLFEGVEETNRCYRLFDASPVIARLAPLVRWLATRWFAVVTLMALLACIALLIADWGRFTDLVAEAARERPFATVLLYYLTFIPVALIHEFGHASVIGHHGGEVPEVVIRRNAHFAVLTNKTVLKDRAAEVWYLSMGTVTDIYIWLALLIAFHYTSNYLLLMFLLPHTIYFMLYSYTIFNNSDFLKAVAAWLGQPAPRQPLAFLRSGWHKRPESGAARQLLYVMSASYALQLVATVFLVLTFAFKEYRVLVLYAVYKLFVYVLSHWPQWEARIRNAER